jgi:hypothetical protein
MESRYEPVSMYEQHPDHPFTRKKSSRTLWVVGLAIISTLNICVLSVSLGAWHAAGQRTNSASNTPVISSIAAEYVKKPALNLPGSLARVDTLPVSYVPFHWHTPWGSQNVSEADTLWENLNTAHGHIAVDHDWAAANQVGVYSGRCLQLDNMELCSGNPRWTFLECQERDCISYKLIINSTVLYVFIDTALSLCRHRCVAIVNDFVQRIIRTLFLSMHRHQLPKYPIHHALHCFDAIRQHIMCNADNTPLYGHGDGTAGDGQVHQCKSWTALRDYATRNTACFRDGEPGMTFNERFGVCDDGTDGLEDGALSPES